MSSKKQKSSRFYMEVLRPMFKGWEANRHWERRAVSPPAQTKDQGRVVQFNLPQKIG